MWYKEFKNLYLGSWKISEEEKLLYTIAESYHKECEKYDRLICSGIIINDSIMPSDHEELMLINKNAIKVRERLYKDFPQFTRQEINKAIKNYR